MLARIAESWKVPGNQAHVRLYDASGLKMERVVTTIEEMRATAMSWRESVMAAVDPADRPRIERADERRKITRAGRRDTDPVPICPSCGLPAANRHGSDAECVAALRLEVTRSEHDIASDSRRKKVHRPGVIAARRRANPTTGTGKCQLAS